MTKQKTKWFNRGIDSVLSSLRVLIVPLVNFTAAYIVIQQSGQAVWGQFVQTLIFVSITSMFLGFGIKDHVLREASLNSGQLGSLVKSGIVARSVLLIPSILAASLIFPIENLGWYCCWLVSMLIYSGIGPIVDFNRSYRPAIVGELMFGAVLIAFLFFVIPDLVGLIMAFSVAALLRSLVLLVLFRNQLLNGTTKFDLKLLAAGLPFLAMSFTGMLQSKTDLYVVAALLGDADLAVYQVTVNFFVYLQALSALISMPFAKNMIRLPKRAVYRTSFKLAIMGLLVLIVSLPLIYLVLNHLYSFGLGPNVIVVGGLSVLPSFIYLPLVYNLIGKKREKTVLYINVFGVIFNLILSYLLIIDFGIIGGLVGSMVAQWAMFGCYLFKVVYKTDDSR